jgi:hypothetical protein
MTWDFAGIRWDWMGKFSNFVDGMGWDGTARPKFQMGWDGMGCDFEGQLTSLNRKKIQKNFLDVENVLQRFGKLGRVVAD